MFLCFVGLGTWQQNHWRSFFSASSPGARAGCQVLQGKGRSKDGADLQHRSLADLHTADVWAWSLSDPWPYKNETCWNYQYFNRWSLSFSWSRLRSVINQFPRPAKDLVTQASTWFLQPLMCETWVEKGPGPFTKKCETATRKKRNAKHGSAMLERNK